MKVSLLEDVENEAVRLVSDRHMVRIDHAGPFIAWRCLRDHAYTDQSTQPVVCRRTGLTVEMVMSEVTEFERSRKSKI